MRPPQAAARFARLKNTLMKKHCMMVATQKTSRKTKITDGSLYLRTLPYWFRKQEQNRLKVMFVNSTLQKPLQLGLVGQKQSLHRDILLIGWREKRHDTAEDLCY